MQFLHSFNPQPILLQFGPLTLHWYGLTMVMAIVAGVAIVRALAQRTGLAQPETVFDLAFVVTLSALVGARLYAVLLFWPEYAAQPLEIFKVWHGGLAIHGALLGGTLALWFYCRRKRFAFWAWADVVAVALPLGQAIGRWGNYFNQELFGPPTNLPWGIFIAPKNRPVGMEQLVYFHPTFLYESLLNFALFLVLLWLYYQPYRKKSPKTMTSDHTRSHDLRPMTGAVQTMPNDHTRRHDLRLKTGTVLALYLLGYGAIRLLMETLRLDDTPTLLGLRWPVIVSVLLIVGGLVGLTARQRLPMESH